MVRRMRVRAVAAPSQDSNAVGSLELECLPQGLLMIYLGVGAYTAGYAPAALTSGTQVLVPWNAIEQLELRPDHLFLSFDRSLSPHHRLCLTGWSDGSELDPEAASHRRRILRLGAGSLTLVVLVVLSSQLPAWSARTTQWMALVIGSAAAIAVLALGLAMERLVIPRPDPDRVRARFVAALRHYQPVPVSRARSAPAGPEFRWSDLITLLPRSSFAVAIVLIASSLAALLTSSWLLSPDAAANRAPASPLPPDRLARADLAGPAQARALPNTTPEAPGPPAPSPTAPPPAAHTDPTAPQIGAACKCDHADSVLWGDGFPRLSTLLIEQRVRRHRDHQHLELDLGVINNGSETLREVSLLVEFFEEQGSEVKPTKERPLYYEGPLRPGQAVKWHVQARGTRFVVHNPLKQVVGREMLATSDDFSKLLNANHRPVRLHGAMMLAFLRDPRAKHGALRLREALRESEAPYLDRVLATQGDLVTCNWAASESGRIRDVQTCVYNVSSKRVEQPALEVRALERHFDHRNPLSPPPVIIAERRWVLEQRVEPTSGYQVQVKLDTDNPDGTLPGAFEVIADHAERL